MMTMKAIRLHIKQNRANYRREETVNCRMTYPLPPYSTVIGAIHDACSYKTYHPMYVSIQGKYSSLHRKMFKEDCFLNSLQNDRGILVKMCCKDALCSAYTVVASAIKTQGNDFEKGIAINVANEALLDEYRALKRLSKRIDDVNKRVKEHKTKSKTKEYKAFIKRLEGIVKKFKEEKYTQPYSQFRTLTKAPKYYEMLYDVELMIHIVSDEATMSDIMANIDNLISLGRAEDFVEIISAEETELSEIYESEDYDDYYTNSDNADMLAYIPLVIVDNNDQLQLDGNDEGVKKEGTKYLINKNYIIENRKRIFEKIPVLCSSKYNIDRESDGVLFDTYNYKGKELIYPVFLA